ncbi:acyl-CoA thioesterase/BAAT N-terminal domain-containing protein [Haloarcula sp. S1CR25-12]|uniref:Acyl-CoA thioesterase/BAAT N-terminal domain-containing protein n=1 Tax=Haloarcula saliterrae TaxID=2950534 RepID=A0ABU2FB63_9EURY|nr:acyl-CoA thioester hydrolase/BAAT C-terminal domain-containing protein [Haloarcula sp. S1CR25-12]MDS0259489.1 acyl-CoA thioesterase/BAAT N-terminal domain-containing protein [Haloarcula sp. S1CR25-12]
MTDKNQFPPLIGRRRLLTAAAAAGLGTLPGCGGLGDESDTGTATDDARTDSPRTPTGNDPADAAIEVPATARIDESISPTLSGLPPGERVSVEAATSTPGPDGPVDWSSSATFAVGDGGTVTLGSQSPVAGDYDDADPMGLFWAMETDLAARRALFPLRTHEVTITVTDTQGRALAETTTERVLPSVEQEPLGDEFAGTVHYPPSDGPAPGVVLLHGSQPRELRGPARLLAANGFVAASLQYFGEPEPVPETLVEVPVEYVVRACETLAANDRVAGEQVGLYGASKGAELALLSGANSDVVGAVVSVSGGGLVWEGIESLGEAPDASSWTIDGEPVPYIPYPERQPTMSNGRAYYGDGFEAAAASTVEAATIPVERIDGPVEFVAGSDDRLWNSPRYSRLATDRLDGSEYDYAFDLTVYDGAGHSITPPFTPTYGSTQVGPLVLGGSPAANATAAREHWPDVLSVLERGLSQ